MCTADPVTADVNRGAIFYLLYVSPDADCRCWNAQSDGKTDDQDAAGDSGGTSGGVLQAATVEGDEKEGDAPAKVASNSKSNLSFMVCLDPLESIVR